MLDQAPCGPAVPCLSRQARAAVMVRLRGEADAGHRSAVSGHRSPVKQVIGRQCHSGVSVIVSFASTLPPKPTPISPSKAMSDDDMEYFATLATLQAAAAGDSAPQEETAIQSAPASPVRTEELEGINQGR